MANNKQGNRPNVPSLRFPGFSDEWQKTTLGDITVNFSRRNKEVIEYPMYSVTNNRGFIPQNEQFEDREMQGEDIKAYKLIENNDFAYNPARINVGSIAKYNGNDTCMISSLYVCFRVSSQIDEEWMMHLLKTPKMNYEFNINGEGGVRIYLFYPNFARIKTSYPNLKEQKKIASFLSLLDERIATQRKIIEGLETLIRGISKYIFLSVKPSEKVQLAMVANLYQPKTINSSELISNGIFPVYGANGIVGYYDKYNHLEPQICITCRGNTCGCVNYSLPKSWITGNSMVVNIDGNNNVDKRFLFYQLKTINFRDTYKPLCLENYE